jgi:hypothetical protein
MIDLMKYGFLFLGLFTLLPLAGQPSAILLPMADRFCSCMEGIGTESPRIKAAVCLEETIAVSKEDLRRELELDMDNADDRAEILESLIDVLTANCPILQTLGNPEKEEKQRWSDLKAGKSSGSRYKSAKNPPADPSEWVTGEAPNIWSIAGRLASRPGNGKLSLLLADDSTLSFELPPNNSQGKKWSAGDPVTITYRREWRKVAGVIVNIVTRIE